MANYVKIRLVLSSSPIVKRVRSASPKSRRSHHVPDRMNTVRNSVRTLAERTGTRTGLTDTRAAGLVARPCVPVVVNNRHRENAKSFRPRTRKTNVAIKIRPSARRQPGDRGRTENSDGRQTNGPLSRTADVRTFDIVPGLKENTNPCQPRAVYAKCSRKSLRTSSSDVHLGVVRSSTAPALVQWPVVFCARVDFGPGRNPSAHGF